MSDTRKRALVYLQKVIGDVSGKLVSTSKFFRPEESWSITKKEAWWFDLPINKIEANANDFYYLECEDKDGSFITLRVPNKFLLDNRDKFDTKSRNNMIRLHLAAYPEKLFTDERVSNGMDFSGFKIS